MMKQSDSDFKGNVQGMESGMNSSATVLSRYSLNRACPHDVFENSMCTRKNTPI